MNLFNIVKIKFENMTSVLRGTASLYVLPVDLSIALISAILFEYNANDIMKKKSIKIIEFLYTFKCAIYIFNCSC